MPHTNLLLEKKQTNKQNQELTALTLYVCVCVSSLQEAHSTQTLSQPHPAGEMIPCAYLVQGGCDLWGKWYNISAFTTSMVSTHTSRAQGLSGSCAVRILPQAVPSQPAGLYPWKSPVGLVLIWL